MIKANVFYNLKRKDINDNNKYKNIIYKYFVGRIRPQNASENEITTKFLIS